MFRALKKKWSLFIAPAVITTLLMGCGGGGAPQQQSQAPQGGASGNEIVVGANFELTGDLASYGNSGYKAAELAIDEVNKAGGVLGKQIKLIKYDNQSKKPESTNVATRLVTQDKAVAIIGPATSGVSLAAVPVVNDKKVPMISPTATNPDVTVDPNTKKVNEYVFRACFLDSFQGEIGSQFVMNMAKDKGKKAAVLFSASDDYSKGLANFFKTSFTKAGGTVVAEEGFNKDDQDYRAILTRVKTQSPDVIYIPAYYENVGKIAKQARELGITEPLVGGDSWDSPKLTEIAGAEALNNTFFTNHYTAEDPDPTVQTFVKAYQTKYNEVPDAFAALSYDAAKMVVEAIKQANSPEPEKIKAALAGLKDFPSLIGKMSLDANHDPIKPIVIVEMKNGKQSVKEKIAPKQ